MFDPTTFQPKKPISGLQSRRGAIMPLFALLLPLLLIFAGFAINLAYMQLVSTELKIATDASCHAGGRAMSYLQTDDIDESVDLTIFHATRIAQANLVAGRQLSVGTDDEAAQITLHFGRSIRGDNAYGSGFGMYEFTEIPVADVRDGTTRPSSLGVTGDLDIPMIFRMVAFDPDVGGAVNHGSQPGDIGTGGSGGGGGGTREAASLVVAGTNLFHPARRSIATQVDRDIALVLDRSGSMLYYRDEVGLEDTLEDLYNTYETTTTPGYYEYAYWKWRNGRWRWQGWYKEEDAHSSWENFDYAYSYWVEGETYSERLISWSEYQDATDWLYDRTYSNNVIYQLEKWTNTNHTLGSTYSSSENSELTDEKAMYCQDWKYVSGAPRFSRWWYLDQGVTAFLDVLDITDQEELVSLVTFSDSATLEYSLQDNYANIRNKVDGISPYGGTAIGSGMTTGLPPIVSGPGARPFAAKTIVVLTDGENNNGQDPEAAVQDIMDENEITVHAVTFSLGADKDTMTEVARIGHGRHYHADDGSALIEIFEEIANNLPTILTE